MKAFLATLGLAVFMTAPTATGPLAVSTGWGVATASAAGAWHATGSMSTSRTAHAAVLLKSGEALVVGGFNSTGMVGSAELYNPVAATWTVTGSLNVARDYATATLLPSGEVLVAGGCCVKQAELYDPTTGAWTVTGSLTTGRYLHSATLLQDGKVLVVGGLSGTGALAFSLATAELYDPATGMWTRTGSLHSARAAHTATLLPSGEVLVAGGCYGRRCGYGLASGELYDPTTGTWSLTGSMTMAHSAHTATLLPDGRVLAAGGNFAGAVAEVYEPSTSTWTPTGSMSTRRAWFTATLLLTGRVLVAGGLSGLASAELYDPSTGVWSATGSMTTGRYEHTAVLLGSGQVLAAGGSNSTSPSLSSAELYTP